MTLEDEVIALRAENGLLRQQLAVALTRIQDLEAQQRPPRPDPPAFVKANRPKPEGPKQARKKRAPAHNRARRREPPTKIERHALDRCPECQYRLHGESVDYSRQVIEVPAPVPVDIIEHQVLKRWCPHCARWRSPKLDVSTLVVGEGRLGVRLASLLSYLRTTLRLPVAAVQHYLQTLHRLHLSQGEIVEILHKVRQRVEPAVQEIKKEAQASPVIHADETGWRENGQNGYVWLLATDGPRAVRYFLRDASRGQAVLSRLLGLTDGQIPTAVLTCDFYVGYNDYAGPLQRCWSHLLRDLHTLKVENADRPGVLLWARSVRYLYDDALAWLVAHPRAIAVERQRLSAALHLRAVAAGVTYARVRDHPCQALAQRLMRHQDELFQFVVRDGVSPDNNLAERAARPLVVMRKISGGTRSAKGTDTRLGLASLLETWRVRGLNPFLECYHLLSTPPLQTPLPQL